MASFFEVNLLDRRRNGRSPPLPGPLRRDAARPSSRSIYTTTSRGRFRSLGRFSASGRPDDPADRHCSEKIEPMSEPPEPGVIGSLPSTRPHRRSGRRAPVGEISQKPKATARKAKATAPRAKPAASRATAKPKPAKPAAARARASERPRPPRDADTARDDAPGAVQTVVEAAPALT